LSDIVQVALREQLEELDPLKGLHRCESAAGAANGRIDGLEDPARVRGVRTKDWDSQVCWLGAPKPSIRKRFPSGSRLRRGS
jgi:hypothetical protein